MAARRTSPLPLRQRRLIAHVLTLAFSLIATQAFHSAGTVSTQRTFSRRRSPFILASTKSAAPVNPTETHSTAPPADTEEVGVSFSHLHLYVDSVNDVEIYKDLENKLNEFASEAYDGSTRGEMDVEKCREIWRSIESSSTTDAEFVPQNRDVVKQLIAGLGFRVTGKRIAGEGLATNTKSVLVTSPDPCGVQIVVTAIDEEASGEASDEYTHFDAANLKRFLDVHSQHQGIAVLGFEVTSGYIDTILARYQQKHPNLLTDNGIRQYGTEAKVLEVFAYYDESSDADTGTVLRFIEPMHQNKKNFPCILPGLQPVEATFDPSAMSAYCDHWVSNVVSRTGFLDTLEDTLGFTPKVDFNAGVVAAGEAQIESTVTGNDSLLETKEKRVALKDQSQVYLPINNALSEVGHVHGFLKDIGQGIQHVASRVEDLAAFVQRGNDYRKITGEGFTFLCIPRSYYGVLMQEHLTGGLNPSSSSKNDFLSDSCALAVMEVCENFNVASPEGAVHLDVSAEEVGQVLDTNMPKEHMSEYTSNREEVIEIILRSRYTNLYSLLQDHLSEESYLSIVRNQILVDVQGDDLLFQIFTSNILQRKVGEEAPFFEFIQRVCSECTDSDGCPVAMKPGCGGFGIRNFLTLFLSIEVSKAMLEVSQAKASGDEARRKFAQSMVDIFTNQLNESNPILTEISDAMTLEGRGKEQLDLAMGRGDEEAAAEWRSTMEAASETKNAGNQKLMECSAKYMALMRSLRETQVN